MLQDNTIRRPGLGLFSAGTFVAFAAVTALSTIFIQILPAVSIADGTVPIILDVALFFIILCVVVCTAVVHKVETRQLIYWLALTIWWMLLVDEVFFMRTNTGFAMGRGEFSVYAYADGAMWLICMTVLLILTVRWPKYIPQAFKGSSKWVTFFVVLCVISTAWAPGPLYAMAWSVKLVLAILLLQLCSSLMEKISDVTLFLKVTAFAFVFLSVLPVYYAINDPDGFFVEGRLNADPDLLGPLAASLMLMSLLLYSLTKKRYWILTGVVGAIVMLLAFGKAGVVGGFLGALLFMVLQRKVVRSLGLMIGLSALALVIVSVTPLGQYLQTYRGASTLTGRTVIWGFAIAAIKLNPIFGHGYLGTYYSFTHASGLVHGAVHVHNGFLEVAYNNGGVGEFLLLMIHFVMLRNIFISMRVSKMLRTLQPASEQAWHSYLITIACLAIYIHTFVQGLFGGHFGGRCMSPYMLWLALAMLSATIRRINEHMLDEATLKKVSLFSEETFGSLRPASSQSM
ncbi:MAG TPA: O-antigen ligase family protein [Terriglobales bacterium]|jgi:O-antigen ligase|nr:O-antigen ligase family protein [Terriglobales bacterium]